MTQKIAEAVDGFQQMNARQQTIHQWTVTSWRNDTLTVHQVDLLKGTCTCKDNQYNKPDEGACAHIMKANHQAQAQMDVGEAMNYFLHERVKDIEDIVDWVDQKTTGIKADQAAEDTDAADGSTDDDDDGFDGDPVAAFEDLLEEQGLDPNDFAVWIDDQYGSLQADTDAYLSDSEFDAWVDLKDELDMGYDGDNDVNYLQADRFGEVFG